jgi:hypothetical protein
METLLPADSDWCNFPKHRSARACKTLIALAKEGVVSVGALAEGGLLHLVSLTPEAHHWGHLKIEGAGARFQREWRVRVLTLPRQ